MAVSSFIPLQFRPYVPHRRSGRSGTASGTQGPLHSQRTRLTAQDALHDDARLHPYVDALRLVPGRTGAALGHDADRPSPPSSTRTPPQSLGGEDIQPADAAQKNFLIRS